MKTTHMAGAALAAGLLAATPAAAFEFTGTFPGGDCAAMARTTPPARLWYGHFTGQRQWGTFQEQIQTRTAAGCFASKAVCENWLYQWRSTYQYNFWNDYCAPGWPPAPRPAGPRNG
ncbi:MAG TPA: hypothetical protein VLA00_17910 [Xanthobacteraceae bacterium]|nr:hypothetical protein [Xanthobacteraceae bacterium]